MATHKSARKRARQALVRRTRNRHQRSRVRSAVKSLREALAQGDGAATATALRNAESILRRAASKGILHWKTASRQVSRLTRAANKS